MTNCPNCNAAVSESTEQCTQCGIFFAKWREREEKMGSGAYQMISHATSSAFNWIILVVFSGALVGIIYFVAHQD